MSSIEWPRVARLIKVGRDCFCEVFAWSGLFVACLCSLKSSRSVRLVSPIYCFLHILHWTIYVTFVGESV